MVLSSDDAEVLFNLYGSLMQFANKQLEVATDVAEQLYMYWPPDRRCRVTQAFIARLDLIDAFVTAHSGTLSEEEVRTVRSWRHLVAGRFIALRQLKKHTILLPCNRAAIAYGVLGLSQPLNEVIALPLPAMIETVLLPFRGAIVCYGVVNTFPVHFGPGSRRRFEEEFRTAKAIHRLITTLTA
jgi:hypothetical protein